MKNALFIVAACLTVLIAGCATHRETACCPTDEKTKVVDAGCGQCLLGLKEKKGCDLAVRMDGKSYFVDGFTMKQMGDAHANDGMCNTLRNARVSGEVVNGRFAASSFELLPVGK